MAKAQTKAKEQNFVERITRRVSVEINGKEYRLIKYTMLDEVNFKELLGGDEAVANGFEKMDAGFLLKALYFMLEDKSDFADWKALGEAMDGTTEEKMNMGQAIAICINQSKPDAVESLKKRVQAERQKLNKATAKVLTGP